MFPAAPIPYPGHSATGAGGWGHGGDGCDAPASSTLRSAKSARTSAGSSTDGSTSSADGPSGTSDGSSSTSRSACSRDADAWASRDTSRPDASE